MAKQARQRAKQESNGTAPIRMAADNLPRKSLEQSIRIAETLHRTFAGRPTSVEAICKTMEIGSQTGNSRYLFLSAQAYGLITKEKNVVTLAETGRKIVAPTYDGEDREGKIKAILTPIILSKFYTDYDGHALPADEHFPNVLESSFEIPRERVAEAIPLILSNAEYAGILDTLPDGQKQIKLNLKGTDRKIPVDNAGQIDRLSDTIVTSAQSIEDDWSTVCFYITPIGEEGSEPRKHSDLMLKHLLEPVLKEYNLKVVRADKIDKSGIITAQVFQHIAKARICVSDLSFRNPNAFYELGVRHAFLLPTIQLIRKSDPIPFDVAQGRTITVDTSDVYTIVDRLISARKELSEHVKHILSSKPGDVTDDNPVKYYLPGIKVSIP